MYRMLAPVHKHVLKSNRPRLFHPSLLNPSLLTPSPALTPCCAAPTDAERANSVRPLAFKGIVGKGHSEFSSGHQQDALEYFQHLLEQVGRASVW